MLLYVLLQVYVLPCFQFDEKQEFFSYGYIHVEPSLGLPLMHVQVMEAFMTRTVVPVFMCKAQALTSHFSEVIGSLKHLLLHTMLFGKKAMCKTKLTAQAAHLVLSSFGVSSGPWTQVTQ